MPATLSPVEAELLEQDSFMADLADRYRSDGIRALDGVEIDGSVEDFISDLLSTYPGEPGQVAA